MRFAAVDTGFFATLHDTEHVHNQRLVVEAAQGLQQPAFFEASRRVGGFEAAFESYREMQDDLLKEKTVITTQWAKREKRLLKAMENLVCLYGDVKGIAGGAVQEIKALELDSALSLEE